MSQAKVDRYKEEKANRKNSRKGKKKTHRRYYLWMGNRSPYRWLGRIFRLSCI